MTETKTTTKEISKAKSSAAETSAIATNGKEGAATDNIYLTFLQKAFPSFDIPADALKKSLNPITKSWPKTFSLQAFPA